MENRLPFYVVTFNRIKGLKMAVEFVNRSNLPLSLIVLDMGSTWQPFIDYRDSLGCAVFEFPSGMGPRDLWKSGQLITIGEGGFFLSDGDIDYKDVPNDAATKMLEYSRKYPWFPKIGLALKIIDLPNDAEGRRIREWAKMDWAVPFNDECFISGLDTTIAYYPRRETVFYYRPALRLAGKYQANHYPWYERLENQDEESKFYSSLASKKISSAADGLIASNVYKIKRLIWKQLFYFFKLPLKFEIFAKPCIWILSINGKIVVK